MIKRYVNWGLTVLGLVIWLAAEKGSSLGQDMHQFFRGYIWVFLSLVLLYVSGELMIKISRSSESEKRSSVRSLLAVFLGKLFFTFGVGWYVLSQAGEHLILVASGALAGFLVFSLSNYCLHIWSIK